MFNRLRRNRLLWVCLLGILASLLLVGCGGKQADKKSPGSQPGAQAPKDDAQAFYKGKTIEWLVPYSSGGGYDAYARTMSRYLEKQTGATVVVLNKPGGGGLTAINELYQSKPDGLTIAIMNGSGAAQAQLTGDSAAQYDLTKMTWLGNLVVDAQAFYVSKKSGFTSMEDMIKAGKVKFGATGTGGNTYMNIVAFAEALRPLGLDLELVMGFKSSGDTRMAMLRGDIAGTQGSYSSAAELVQSGDGVVVAQLGNKRAPEMPDVPLVQEVKGIAADGQKLIQMATNLMLAGRPVLAPPGVPAERVKFLRDAITKVFSDPAFLDEAAKQQLAIGPQSGEELEKTIKELLTLSEADKKLLTAAMDKYR